MKRTAIIGAVVFVIALVAIAQLAPTPFTKTFINTATSAGTGRAQLSSPSIAELNAASNLLWVAKIPATNGVVYSIRIESGNGFGLTNVMWLHYGVSNQWREDITNSTYPPEEFLNSPAGVGNGGSLDGSALTNVTGGNFSGSGAPGMIIPQVQAATYVDTNSGEIYQWFLGSWH